MKNFITNYRTTLCSKTLENIALTDNEFDEDVHDKRVMTERFMDLAIVLIRKPMCCVLLSIDY